MKTFMFVAVGMLLLGMCGCKGRTANDVTPTGETVEVIIPESLPDSLQ